MASSLPLHELGPGWTRNDSGRGGRDPVQDAEVEFTVSGLETTTNRSGMFVFPGVPPGQERLRIRHLTYGEQTRTLELEPGRAYRVRGVVSPDPIELEGIQVTSTSQNWLVGAALRSVVTVERRTCLRSTREPMLIVE
jgi:hypothetical protein